VKFSEQMKRESAMRLSLAMQDLMGDHYAQCSEHPDKTHMPEGVVGIDAVCGRFVCKWCNAKEDWQQQFEPFAFKNVMEAQPWLCRVLKQGDQFFRVHIKCSPHGAKPKRARLKMLVTSDGMTDMGEHVHVGDEYEVFPNTLRELDWGHNDRPGKYVKRLSVWANPSLSGHEGWMPVEMLDIEGGVQ
jgi:hypothetical protein